MYSVDTSNNGTSQSTTQGKKSDSYNFIFLHGIRVRSGTNYLGRFFSKHPDIQSMPPDKTNNEFPLLYNISRWKKAFNSFNGPYFTSSNLFSFDDFLPYLGESWKKYIIDSFPYNEGHIFIKDPNVENLNYFFKMFPDSKLIILLRDGRDNVSSCLKGTLAVRRSTPFLKQIKDRFNHYTLRSFIYFCRKWRKAVRNVLEFDKKFKNSEFKDQYMIVKYEDLVEEPQKWGDILFSFCGAEVNDEILANLNEIEVMGSSFFGKDGAEKTNKPIWTPLKPTKNFKPVGRWSSWNGLQKRIFKKIAGEELIAAGYTKDLNW